jgi:hypothetical protein
LRLIQGANAKELAEREIEPGQAWRNEPGTVHSIVALEDGRAGGLNATPR